MLYDPKWEKKTQADPLSLEALIAWLETQPADVAYDYQCNGHCMLAQYFAAQGLENVNVGGVSFDCGYPVRTAEIPFHFGEIAYGGAHPYGRNVSEERTFGAALERARAAYAISSPDHAKE